MEKWEDGKELIFPLRGPSKGNWKKISRDQGQQAQNPNTHTQNISGLSGSKRTGKLDFSDEDEKGRTRSSVTHPTQMQTTLLIDRRWLQSITAKSNEFTMLELPGN